MPWKVKSIGIFGIAASLAALYLAFVGTSGGTIAVAQALNKLNSAKSLSFDVEVKSVNDDKVLNKSRSYYLVPGKHRSESRGKQEGFVVFDSEVGKVLMVDAKTRTARVSSFKAAGRDMAAETIKGIRELKAEDAKALGEKKIDGKQANGYEFTEDVGVTTVWIDAEIGAPLRIEVLHKQVPNGPVLTTWTNIKLDEQLDAGLFSLKPPAGFKVMPFVDIDLNASPANFVAQLLKMYAKHNEDEFPADLEKGLQKLIADVAPKDGEAPTEEAAQLSFYGAAAAAIVRTAKKGEVWQYYPGVKLGQKKKIVFWLLDKRKKQYSAVYGDLRIEVVEKDELPKLSD